LRDTAAARPANPSATPPRRVGDALGRILAYVRGLTAMCIPSCSAGRKAHKRFDAFDAICFRRPSRQAGTAGDARLRHRPASRTGGSTSVQIGRSRVSLARIVIDHHAPGSETSPFTRPTARPRGGPAAGIVGWRHGANAGGGAPRTTLVSSAPNQHASEWGSTLWLLPGSRWSLLPSRAQRDSRSTKMHSGLPRRAGPGATIRSAPTDRGGIEASMTCATALRE